MEVWEYSYSFGEPEQNGKKIRIKKYDASGNKTYDWTPSTFECFFKYDLKGQRIEIVLKDSYRLINGQPSKTITTFTYDVNGNLLTKAWDNCMLDGSSCKETYEYDDHNRKTKQFYFIGSNIADKYTFKNDEKGNCIEKVTFAKDGSTKSTYYKYNDRGNLLKDDSYSFKYDSLGRNIEKISYDQQGKVSTKYTFKYNVIGNKTEESSYSPQSYYNNQPLNPASESKTTYKYNGIGQIVERKYFWKSGVQSNRDDKYTYTYDANGNLTQEIVIYNNGEPYTIFNQNGDSLKTTYKYDDKGNIIEIIKSDKNGNPNNLEKFIYTFYGKIVPVTGKGTGGDSLFIDFSDVGDFMVDDDPSPDEFIQVDVNPVPIKKVDPIYPDEARKANIEGRVFVKTLVDKQGNVKKAVIMSGPEIFHKATIEAAMQWVFKPAMQRDKPIAVWVALPFQFNLR